MAAAAEKPIDANHAFYLGYEMAKAATALTLGKDYRQDEALDWGFLTRAENSHRLARGERRSESAAGGPTADDATDENNPAVDNSADSNPADRGTGESA
jgi:hypothetical protein